MNMFHKEVTLAAMTFLTVFPFIICPEEPKLPENKDDLEAIRECFKVCSEPKIDMSLYTTEIYLGIMCERNRMRKTEFNCDKELIKKGYDYTAADFMKTCLKTKSKPSTYDHYFIQGKKLQNAREFMKKESLSGISLPRPEQESPFEKLESNQKPELIQKPKTNEDVTIENSSEEEFDINDLPKVTDYSTFADGVCYKRYFFNSNQETPSYVNCLILCVEKFFIEIERILVDEFAEIEKIIDKSSIKFQPEADIFEMVCRLTGVKSIQKFTSLGEKWLINYTTAYRKIKIRHRDEFGKVEMALKTVMNSYIECLQSGCATDSPTTKNLLFYDWMDDDLEHEDSHYYDANDQSRMLHDSHAYHDSQYHDASDSSKILEDFSTNHIHRLDPIGELSGDQNGGNKRNKSAKRKLVDDPNSGLNIQKEKKIK